MTERGDGHSETDLAGLASLQCEQALLGAILLHNEAIDRVGGVVQASDFSEPLHSDLFTLFAEMRREGRAITPMLVVAALGQSGRAEISPGRPVSQYIARLASAATTIVNAPDFARTIRECADRRRMRDIAGLLNAGIGEAQNPAALASQAIDQLDAIVSEQPRAQSNVTWIGDAAARSLDRMQWGMQNPGKLSGVSWGLRDLDAKTNGLQRGDLIILAGRPGMGKSGVALSGIRQSAEAGNNVLLFSLEMGDVSISDRVLSDITYADGAEIPYHSISRGAVSDAQAERLVLAAEAMRRLPVRIDQTAALSVPQMAARARRHKQKLERAGETLDLMIVDHMHLVKASERYAGNRVGEITEISGGLKALAKELDVPVLALAQLSRNVESRDDKRPMMSDLRDSGAIEQDADVIVFLYREAYYLERARCDDPEKEDARLYRMITVKNTLEAIVAKQRNGPSGTVDLFFDPACNAARNLARPA